MVFVLLCSRHLFAHGAAATQLLLNLTLAVVLECLPELGPRLPQAVAYKNVSVPNAAVFDPEAIADMASNLIGLERTLCKVARHV